MQIAIKEFNVDMEIKTKGIELEVRDPDGTHRGDLVLTKTTVIWCRGRTTRANGKSLTWTKFMEMMDTV